MELVSSSIYSVDPGLVIDRQLMTIGALGRADAGLDRLEEPASTGRRARLVRDDVWRQLWDSGGSLDDAGLSLALLGAAAEIGRLAWGLAAPLAGALADDELAQLGGGRD